MTQLVLLLFLYDPKTPRILYTDVIETCNGNSKTIFFVNTPININIYIFKDEHPFILI